MLKKLINNLLGQQPTQHQELTRDKYFRYRHAMGLMGNQFPFLREIERWVEDTSDFYDIQLMERCIAKAKVEPSLSVYDLVALNDYFRQHLIANDIIAKTSRKRVLYFDKNAADLFFGYALNTTTVTLTVTDAELMERLQIVVNDFLTRHGRRNGVGKIKIHCRYEEDLSGYKVFPADLFSNIPCLIPEEYDPVIADR